MGDVFIPLTKGKCARIDLDDLVRVLGLNWVAVESRSGGPVYARSTELPYIYMHRLLCPGNIIDHVNGDGLDNRASNLRSTTASVNQANRVRRAGSTAPYKNVRLNKGKFEGRAMVEGTTVSRWGFETAEAAKDWIEAEIILRRGFDPSRGRR